MVFPERRSAQVNETVMRASAGTAGRVPLVRVVNLARALEQLQEAGAWVYGLAGGAGSRDYLEEPFDRGTVLVLGSEGEGLHQKIREHCDGLLAHRHARRHRKLECLKCRGGHAVPGPGPAARRRRLLNLFCCALPLGRASLIVPAQESFAPQSPCVGSFDNA